MNGLGTATQDDRIAGFQAERGCIAGDVRPRFVNETYHTNGHPDLANPEAVWAHPFAQGFTHRIVQRRDIAHAVCHGPQPFLIQTQTVNGRGSQSGKLSRVHVLTVCI